MLTLKGCLISIDAAGCQKNIAEQVIKQGGDYLLAVKGNQATLHEMTKSHMNKIIEKQIIADDDFIEKSHGRNVRRRLFVSDAPNEIKEFGFVKLSSTIAIETITKHEHSPNVSAQLRYYISSKPTKTNFSRYIREHWCIENQLHWVLDVNFCDDSSRSRERNSSLALSALKRIAINIVDPEDKSVRRKLRHAAWDINHLEKIILQAV